MYLQDQYGEESATAIVRQLYAPLLDNNNIELSPEDKTFLASTLMVQQPQEEQEEEEDRRQYAFTRVEKQPADSL